jgi:hypothetical protein
MDEDLKLADRLARHAVGEVNELEDDLFAAHEAIIRLSAAAERERELVEALRPFAVWAERMPDLVPEFPRDISKVVQIAIANGHLTGAHFRNAARVVQVKEAGE